MIESFLLSKHGEPDGGEDGVYIDDRYIVVLDGATAKTEWYKGAREEEGMKESLGLLAKKAILEVLPSAPSSQDPMDFLRFVNDAVAKMACGLSEKPQASIIAYSCACREIWSYGDCQCLIDGVLHENKKLADVLLARKRSRVIAHLLKEGASKDRLLRDDKGRDAIQDELKRNTFLANRIVDGGYPVLDGAKLVEDFLVVYPVPENAHVVLATDGYPVLERSLEASEERLANIIEEDPLMAFLSPQTKGVYAGQVSFDDRAYVRYDTGVSDGA